MCSKNVILHVNRDSVMNKEIERKIVMLEMIKDLLDNKKLTPHQFISYLNGIIVMVIIAMNCNLLPDMSFLNIFPVPSLQLRKRIIVVIAIIPLLFFAFNKFSVIIKAKKDSILNDNEISLYLTIDIIYRIILLFGYFYILIVTNAEHGIDFKSFGKVYRLCFIFSAAVTMINLFFTIKGSFYKNLIQNKANKQNLS